MAEETADFWQTHSLNYLEMAFRSDKLEIPRDPDGRGEKTGACGDTIAMFLKLSEDRLEAVTFSAKGCLNTVACANTVSHLAEGRTLEEAWEIAPETVVNFLQTLPPHETHCAELAVGAFYLALADCEEMRRNPWKRAYRKR
jgi:nitrogen fixation NifU-like protein